MSDARSDVEDLIRTTTSGRVAGFIAEPIQGVGGFITPPKEYFKIVERTSFATYGGIFISDEVQTGWGRTGGKWFGIEQYGVTPDMITARQGTRQRNAHWANGGHARRWPTRSRDSRSRHSAATRYTTTAAQSGDRIHRRGAADGQRCRTGHVFAWQVGRVTGNVTVIGDVRGMGLIQALELVEDGRSRVPATALTGRIMQAARDQRLLIGKGGTFGNCLRVTPPLNITRADVDEFAARLDASFAAVLRT